MSNLLKKDRNQLKEDLSKMKTEAEQCSPSQPLPSLNRDMEITVQIADEEPCPRYSNCNYKGGVYYILLNSPL